MEARRLAGGVQPRGSGGLAQGGAGKMEASEHVPVGMRQAGLGSCRRCEELREESLHLGYLAISVMLKWGHQWAGASLRKELSSVWVISDWRWL